MLRDLRFKTLEDFKVRFEKVVGREKGFADVTHECTQFFLSKFNEGCKDIEQIGCDISKVSKVREELHLDIDSHVQSVRMIKIIDLMFLYVDELNEALSEPVEALLDDANDETWPAMRRLLQQETETIVSSFLSAISSFDIDERNLEQLLATLKECARSVVKSKARKEAEKVLMRMKYRFSAFFDSNFDSMPRIWTKKKTTEITKLACLASLKLLSVIAVIRLEEDNDNVERTLQLALVEVPNSLHLLDSNTWEDVPLTRTLIKPNQCESLWMQFKTGIRPALAAKACFLGFTWMPSPLATYSVIGVASVVAMLVINHLVSVSC